MMDTLLSILAFFGSALAIAVGVILLAVIVYVILIIFKVMKTELKKIK